MPVSIAREASKREIALCERLAGVIADVSSRDAKGLAGPQIYRDVLARQSLGHQVEELHSHLHVWPYAPENAGSCAFLVDLAPNIHSQVLACTRCALSGLS